MKEHYHLLLITDYSEGTWNAERYAIQFALATDANLTLLHVYYDPLVSMLLASNIGGKPTDYKKNELQKLKNHRNKLFRSLHINQEKLNCNCIVKEGNTNDEILNEVKQFDYDFLVLGTSDPERLREIIFEADTLDIVKSSPVPVLLLPPNASFETLKKMIFVTEFREGEIPIIQFLSHLSKQFNMDLTILHLINYTISKSFEKQLTLEFLNEIKSQTNNNSLTIQIIKNENLRGGLTNYCIQNKIDWLILSAEKHFLFENKSSSDSNVFKNISLQSPPLLIVPDLYNPKFAKYLDVIDVNSYMSEEY